MPHPRKPAGAKSVQAEVVAVRDAGRRWWQAKRLSDIDLNAIELGMAICTAQKVCAVHLVRRMLDPRTPEHVRDALAVKTAAQMGIVLRHEIGVGRGKEHPEGLSEAHEGAGAADRPRLDDVLTACGLGVLPERDIQ